MDFIFLNYKKKKLSIAHPPRCTGSGLKQITCPSGLAFDIEKQTCDWKAKVDNCNKKESKSQKITMSTLNQQQQKKINLLSPLLYTGKYSQMLYIFLCYLLIHPKTTTTKHHRKRKLIKN